MQCLEKVCDTSSHKKGVHNIILKGAVTISDKLMFGLWSFAKFVAI